MAGVADELRREACSEENFNLHIHIEVVNAETRCHIIMTSTRMHTGPSPVSHQPFRLRSRMHAMWTFSSRQFLDRSMRCHSTTADIAYCLYPPLRLPYANIHTSHSIHWRLIHFSFKSWSQAILATPVTLCQGWHSGSNILELLPDIFSSFAIVYSPSATKHPTRSVPIH